MATVPVQITRVQLIANTAGQTNFTYPFLILDEVDIEVYQEGIKLNLGTQYTVTGVGNETGGEIILVTGVPKDTLIILNRNMPIERTTDFTVGGQFTGAAMNDQFDRLTMISQEIETELERRGVVYPVTTNLESDLRENILPQLIPNSGNKISIWSRANAGGLVALQIDEGDDVNTLRSELASQVNGSDGALLVGYYDTAAAIGKTVHVKLDEIDGITADFSNNSNHADCGANLIGYNADSNATTVRDELDVLGNTRAVPLTATLSGSAYSASTPGSIFPFTSYNEDSLFKIKFVQSNAGGVTLNLNSIGAKNLRDMAGDALIAGDIAANTSSLVYFDAAADQFRILSQLGRTIDQWASKAEVEADSAIQKGVYLVNFKNHPGIATAWLNFTLAGVTPFPPVIHDNYHASTITTIGLGQYRVNLSGITMLNTNYTIVLSENTVLLEGELFITNKTTTSFHVNISSVSIGLNVHVVVFGPIV